jgi:hypothetical protein
MKLPSGSKQRQLTVADFPGMVSVCLRHSGEYRAYGDMTWRDGGTASCCCERISDAVERLRAEAIWARQDEAAARQRAESLEAQLLSLAGQR